MEIKVIIADDHKIIREGLISMLGNTHNIKVVAEAENGRKAIQLCRKNHPDVVIVDIGMPELNGVETTRQILKEYPGIKIIALSAYSDKQFVIGMLKAGAKGYLTKEAAFEELNDAILAVMNGKTYLSYDVTNVVVDEITSFDNGESNTLSAREKEVLQLIAEGKSTKVIADNLFISIKTVESHRKNIMEKLRLYTIPELTKYAIRTGLTSLDK